MFSKALFKQSCKANGTMWAIITFAECFMLACVMLISGKGGISATIDAVKDTIIHQEMNVQIESRAINYYETQIDGMQKFDELFVEILPEELADKGNPSLAIQSTYALTISNLQEYLYQKALAIDPSYTADSIEAQEILGCVMYAINPPDASSSSGFSYKGMFDDFYTTHGEDVPEDYVNILSLLFMSDPATEYFATPERAAFIEERGEYCSRIFLAGNMTSNENIERMVDELAKYDITREEYEALGYTYATIKQCAEETVVTYKARLENEIEKLDKEQADYAEKVAKIKLSLAGEIALSFLSSLPADVSSAFEEIGQLNLYGIVVGSIFFRLAGLLLPIIYMIMVSNNLIAGQVDSGSMAYVLSSSTKRQTVVRTQAAFLILSLFGMFALTAVTSCICLAFVGQEVAKITYGQILLFNLGAFLVLFALSGLCFFTSCWFDRSKRSMAIGGGLSIFALVAAMLGLFGSKVIPTIVRLNALNYFNYATVITLFDAISIIEGSLSYLWKFAILLVLGIAGYVIGAVRFVKKDLPL